MAAVIKGLFGGGSKRDRAAQAASAQQAQQAQQADQIQALQQQSQQAAQTEGQLSSARKSNRGRRLLLDTGGGKTTVG